MRRNLLPSLQPSAKIGPASSPTEWTILRDPGPLAHLDFGQKTDSVADAQIQSIPTPWSRFVLFDNALRDPLHPARGLITNEILDAFEFFWTLRIQGGISYQSEDFELADLEQDAAGSEFFRVRDLLQALKNHSPTQQHEGGGIPSERITLGLVNGRPLFAASSKTILVTAEDAGLWLKGPFFQASRTNKLRPLKDRPREFSQYLKDVIEPQLIRGAVGLAPDAPVLGWLQQQLEALDFSGSAVHSKSLEDKPVAIFAGINLFARTGFNSAWTLQSSVSSTQAKPIVIIPSKFDRQYFVGANPVSLPEDLVSESRSVLPGTNIEQRWVAPEIHWFTSELTLVGEPIERDRVYGLGRYESANADMRFARPRVLLPFKQEVFEFYSPAEIEERLSITVASDGSVKASLRIEVGESRKSFEVARSYSPADIRIQGPTVGVWPLFKVHKRDTEAGNQWLQYSVLRIDSSQANADYITLHALADGKLLDARELPVKRTPLTQIFSFGSPPEVVALKRNDGVSSVELGVILPKYTVIETDGDREWKVGIDFGTSNTVIAIADSAAGTESLLELKNSDGNLMSFGPVSSAVLSAYYFPQELSPKPFGTATVSVTSGQKATLLEDPIGARVNIPFSGYVEGEDEWNRVTGDLKWSNEPRVHYLTASFLRYVLTVVAYRAIKSGVAPENISFVWSYPRAFTPTDLVNLTGLWKTAMETVPVKLGGVQGWNPERAATLDESSAILNHFFGEIGQQGAKSAILDIGGGTTDIAVYGEGQGARLDSILFGGRDLTGRRLQSNIAAPVSANPFVLKFVGWSERNGLPVRDAKVIKKYLRDQQDHLAFSYLVGTEWFARDERAKLFSSDPEAQKFKLAVCYFFAALCYYLGLLFRSDEKSSTLITKIILAGNGSRYIDWLTGLRSPTSPTVFSRGFGRLMIVGAGRDPSNTTSPEFQISSLLKEEVARGLIAKVVPSQGETAGMALGAFDIVPSAQSGSVIGEHLRGVFTNDGAICDFAAESRLLRDARIQENDVSKLLWLDSQTEIGKFHESLVVVASSFSQHGPEWESAAVDFQNVFRALDPATLQQNVRARIEYLASAHKGFRGSVFVLEATIVLEKMLGTFFG